jgi:hypothetical protein
MSDDNYDKTFFITDMPASRPADYHLGWMQGCVFLDFNDYEDDKIRLRGISFDGYGYYGIVHSTPLNEEDSKLFKNILQFNLSDQDALLTLVKRAINLNRESISAKALDEYYLS